MCEGLDELRPGGKEDQVLYHSDLRCIAVRARLQRLVQSDHPGIDEELWEGISSMSLRILRAASHRAEIA